MMMMIHSCSRQSGLCAMELKSSLGFKNLTRVLGVEPSKIDLNSGLCYRILRNLCKRFALCKYNAAADSLVDYK